MVEVKNLVKSYGNVLALDDINFNVKQGEVLGFLGPNGAGKSTTLNIIAGYISPSRGSAIVDGFDILQEPLKARRKIGYLPEFPPLYLDMTVKAYLGFVYDLKKVKSDDKNKAIDEVCKKVDILDIKNRLIKNLSKGYKQRIGLAGALLGDPPVLILDEPSVGLDPRQVVEMRKFIRGLGKSHTVILSSHILSEVQEICSRVVIINKGKIIADDLTENLIDRLNNTKKLLLQIEGEKERVRAILKDVEGVLKVSLGKKQKEDIYEYSLELEKADNEDVRRNIFFALAKNSMPLLNITGFTSSNNLEDVFLKLTN